MNAWLELIQQSKFLLRNLKFTLSTSAVLSTGFTLALFLFGFVYSTMYSELPFQNGQQIRVLDSVEKGITYSGNSVPQYIYNDFKDQTTSLNQVSAFKSSRVTISMPNQVRKYIGSYVEPTMFSTLGVSPIYGEVIRQQHIDNKAHVVVLSETSALEMFGNTVTAVGNHVNIHGNAYRVIGVMPDSFKFPRAAKLWLPLEDNTSQFNRGQEGKVSIFGALTPGVTDQQLNNELSIFMDNLRSIHPDVYKDSGLVARRFQEAFLGSAGEIMAISIEVAAIFILLLACVNASNLLYLRAIERKRESSIRLAIGATPSRLFLQMMLESLVICLISAVISIIATHFLLQYLNNNIASAVAFAIPFWWNFQLTSTLILLAFGAALTIATIAGVFPAWKMSNAKFVNTNLSEHKNAVTKSSKLIIIVEVFLASALLLVSATFVFTVDRQNQNTLGFNPDNILSARIALEKTDFDTTNKITNYYQEFEHRLKQGASDSELAFSTALPAHNTSKSPLVIEDASSGAEFPDIKTVKVSNNFFNTLQVPLVEGRHFNHLDQPESTAVAVISQGFANEYFADQNPVGKRIQLSSEQGNWYEIIGVVENIPFGETFDSRTQDQVVFTSLIQSPQHVFHALVKTRTAPYAFASNFRAIAAQVNNAVAPYRVKSLTDAIDQNRASILYITKMFIFLSVVALILTLSGVYSVVSNIIIGKSKEISIRIALGATNPAIFRFISSGILIQTTIGLALGVGLSTYLLTVLARLQIVSFSPVLSIILPITFFIVIIAAVASPLARVLQAPPCEALRQE